MSAWQEYKKNRLQQLKDGAPVKPTDMLNKQNYTNAEIAEKRMAICEDCPRLVRLTKQCKECGCFMNLKTKLAAASCPIGKW